MSPTLLSPLLSIVSRRPRAVRHAFSYDFVLGTSLELQVVADGERAARLAERAVLAEVDRLEAILSGWSTTSELARWLGTHDVDVPVSADLAAVLAMSEGWRVRTGGAFDPAAAHGCVPEADTPHWTIDRARGVARRLTRLHVSLDAIAKGHIVARAAESARAADGVTEVLLNIGGDVQHLGAREVAVGVADPFAPAENAAPIAVVRLANAALATSGGYRRSVVVDGRRVSHIVDPRTGRAAEGIASASVLAPDCATADALSTAFSVMDPHDSVALADAVPGVGCLLVEHDGTITTNAIWNAAAVSPRHDSTHSRNR